MMSTCPVRVAAGLTPEATAVVFGDVTLTYAQLDTRVDSWVGTLAARGVQARDRVALLSLNSLDMVAVLLALSRLDAVAFPLNTRLTGEELSAIVSRNQTRWLLSDRAHANRLPGALILEELTLVPEGTPSAGLVHTNHVGTVVLTSGTTGIPKGAMLTHRAFRTHAAMCAGFLGQSPSHRWLVTMPLFHVGGLSMMWRCLFSGGTLVIHARFDAETALEAFLTQGITHASMVPTTLRRMVLLRGGRRFPRSIQAILVGGGPVFPAIMAHARDAGLPAQETYGLTESCSQACTQRSAHRAGAGPPLPGVEVRILDVNDQPCPTETDGFIHLRTPSVMAGYLDQPDATAAVLRNGWLRTGDLGYLDEQGHLHVLSRRTDLILRGGENVYPAEIEHLLQSLPGVADAAVCAVPHDDLGQVPAAALVLGPEGKLETVQAQLEGRLARFKWPQVWRVTSEIPHNAVGKVDRARLAALFA